mgnify:FL=1
MNFPHHDNGTRPKSSYQTLMNMAMQGKSIDTFIRTWQRQLDATISVGGIILMKDQNVKL